MKRGMIFSADAMIALAMAIVLAGSVAIYFDSLEGRKGSSGSLHGMAADRAMMGFYDGTLLSQPVSCTGSCTGLNETVSNTDDDGKCAVIYTIDLQNGALGSRDRPVKHSVCEGMG